MSSLLPFLPYAIAADLLRHPAEPPQARASSGPAVVLFADVSGFTAMSEALGRIGQGGTEELTGLINSSFARVIELVVCHGGVVGSFGGDSLTAIFPAPDGYASAGRRAISCALAMQGLMRPEALIETRAGSFSLAVKIGLAAGPILTAVAGEPKLRLHSVLAGEALARAADAERHAHTGEVIAHPELADAVPGLIAHERREGFALVVGLHAAPAEPPIAPLPPLPPPPAALAPTLAAFVHAAVARRLTGDQADLVDEHRDVAALFVGFDGFDFDADPEALTRFQRYVADVSRVVRRYDGDLNKIDFGDKGSKFLVVFGAPVAHEDDTERAMHCALALRDLPHPPPRIGVAVGLVFCGLVGSQPRREYTVMGDTVNLAARLMQAAAPGEIVVAAGAHRRVAERFVWEPLAALPVRGRSTPVGVYRLERARERPRGLPEPSYRLPMVGREAEMQLIEERLDLALSGRGQVVGIAAEAGMGKSRLLAEAVRLADRRGVPTISGECPSHGASVSYLPWHTLLRGLFGIDPEWPAEAQVRHLSAQLAAVDSQILARLPLLGVALNLEIPETELTRSLDARTRKDALETTVIAAVRAITGGRRATGAQAPATPLLIVVEDCHWLDPLSHDLLDLVARSIVDRPVLMLLAYRPAERGQSSLRLARLAHFTPLQLREFSLRETEWLIGMKFGYLFGAKGVLPAGFVERLTERSQGNPFYLDQMINFIQDQGISPGDVAALEALRLPTSLRALILSRIDRLAEQEQVTLKVASVIGRAFRADWLWAIYPALGGPSAVLPVLETLSRLDLTALERADPELEYLFKHVVTQEVAYESLTLATRQALHSLVGRYIEARFADEPERYLDMLAYHFGRSDDLERQRRYFRLAADAAREAFANDIALGYYRRLRPLLEPAEQIAILLREGEVLQLVGRWHEAEAAVQEALALAETVADPIAVAHCRTAMAHLLASRGDFDGAIAIIDAVMPVWEELDDPSGHYDALWVLGYVLTEIGEYTRGLRQLEHTHEIATRLGDESLVARSIGYMGVLYVDISDYEMALYCLERSAAMANHRSDWTLYARTKAQIGFVHLARHEVAAAAVVFHGLLVRAVEIGDRRTVARLSREIGRCHQLAGDVTGALRCYGLQIAVGLELGERRDMSVGLGYLASAYGQAGEQFLAERVGETAIALCDTIRLVYWGCEFRLDLARLRFAQGQLDQAAALCRHILAVAQPIGSHRAAQLHARLLLAEIAARQGQPVPALDDLDEEWFGDEERAAIFATIARTNPARTDARAAAAELYRACVAERATIESLRGLAEFAAIAVGPGPSLPPLPDLIVRRQDDLAALVEQAEALLSVAG